MNVPGGSGWDWNIVGERIGRLERTASLTRSVAIVGASLGGCEVAAGLRARGFDGSITLIGEEKSDPYQRPPLSKQYLQDKGTPPADFFLRPPQWYADNRIELITDTRVAAIDRRERGVRGETGTLIPADRIVLATGARARRLDLAGAEAANVHHLRSRDDADRLAAALVPGTTIAIIGMGVIGAEVAATAIGAGCRVVGLEAGEGVMAHLLGARFGHWLGRVHREHGVDTRFGVTVEKIVTEGNRATGVGLADGTHIAADAIVVGIGAVPAIELAAEAGLDTANGILVDASGCTSDPNIFAVGDVANQPGFFGGRVRLETVRNTVDHAATVSGALIGQSGDYCRPNSFWSDQFDVQIQMSGRIRADAEMVMRGELESGRFTALFFAGDVIEAAMSTAGGSDLAAARRLIEKRTSVDKHLAAKPDIALRDLMTG